MRDAAGTPVYRLKSAFLPFNEQAEVAVDPGGEREPALAVLLLLGRYTALIQRRRSHAAG
jgi:MYXO-CTERM domain-containing protein